MTEGREHDPGPLSDAAASDRPALDSSAREELITANLGLAHQLARRFLHRGEPLDDLVQVASVALVKSVDRFDPSRGVDFAAFATRTIIGELKRHFRDKGWAVRASRRVQELYLELGHVTGTLVQQLGRNPTVAELAAATGASEEAVIEAIEAGQVSVPHPSTRPRARMTRSRQGRVRKTTTSLGGGPGLARTRAGRAPGT